MAVSPTPIGRWRAPARPPSGKAAEQWQEYARQHTVMAYTVVGIDQGEELAIVGVYPGRLTAADVPADGGLVAWDTVVFADGPADAVAQARQAHRKALAYSPAGG